MFREMRRFKQALTEERCLEILKAEPRGVLSVHGEDGYPYGFPMDFILLDGKIYFHCARMGHKIDAIKADDRVSFCVMDSGFRREGEWALNISSVIIFGRIKPITDEARAIEVVRALGNKYDPDPANVEREIEGARARLQILELTIDHMTGKLVNES